MPPDLILEEDGEDEYEDDYTNDDYSNAAGAMNIDDSSAHSPTFDDSSSASSASSTSTIIAPATFARPEV